MSVCVCKCVGPSACRSACLYLQRARTSHDSWLRHHTHRQVWGLKRARAQIVEHGLAEQIFLSLSPSNLCLPLALSFNVCLSLGPSVFSLSHCARHRGPLCYSEKEMQLEPNLPWFLPNIIPPLFLRSPIMRLASDNISLTLGNKWSSHRMDLMMYWMSDFKHY